MGFFVSLFVCVFGQGVLFVYFILFWFHFFLILKLKLGMQGDFGMSQQTQTIFVGNLVF